MPSWRRHARGQGAGAGAGLVHACPTVVQKQGGSSLSWCVAPLRGAMQRNIFNTTLLYRIAALSCYGHTRQAAWFGPSRSGVSIRDTRPTKAEKPFSPLHVRQNSVRFRHKCIGSSETRHYTPPLVVGCKVGKNQPMPCLVRRAPKWCDCFWESPWGDSVFSCALRRCRVRPAHFFVRRAGKAWLGDEFAIDFRVYTVGVEKMNARMS